MKNSINIPRFISKGTSMNARIYSLELDGVHVGYASAKVRQNATGMHKVRGVSYTATAFGREFSGSRKVVAREVARAAMGKKVAEDIEFLLAMDELEGHGV